MNKIKGNPNKLPLKTKIGYGATGYGAAMFYNNFCFFALYFFTDYVHLNAAIASLIISLGAVWDAIIDPFIGYLSDKRSPAKGRRRPFLLWFCIPLTIFTWLSFTNPNFGIVGTVIYFTIVVIGAYTFQSLIEIPYSSLGAEITSDYAERADLAAHRNVFWLISIVISSLFLLLVDVFGNVFANGDKMVGYSLASLFCALPIVFTILWTYKSTKGLESKHEIIVKKYSWKHHVIEPLKNKSFRYVVLVFIFTIIAQSIYNSMGLYFLNHTLGMTEIQTTIYLTYQALVGFVGIFIAKFISHRSKKLAYGVLIGSWSLAIILTLFLWYPGASLLFMGLIGFMIGIGLQTQYQLVWALIPDCVEVDEFQTGERREGIFYGMASMMQQVGASLSIAVLGFVLTAIGYDGVAETQSTATLENIRYIYAGGVLLFLVLSIIVNFLNPMTKEKHAALNRAIQLKKEGKEYDITDFKSVL